MVNLGQVNDTNSTVLMNVHEFRNRELTRKITDCTAFSMLIMGVMYSSSTHDHRQMPLAKVVMRDPNAANIQRYPRLALHQSWYRNSRHRLFAKTL